MCPYYLLMLAHCANDFASLQQLTLCKTYIVIGFPSSSGLYIPILRIKEAMAPICALRKQWLQYVFYSPEHCQQFYNQRELKRRALSRFSNVLRVV